eukprot:TRINITY_DN5699_c0_g1_i1.p1 TRINITY_DN5699_c0_g1~~TRINITY_DN5699_c0_g1_i1.p1  ORF type:complete len:424 (+),score=150.19 TRINITY_DN5699_c0_g1_i1:70-1341(+)
MGRFFLHEVVSDGTFPALGLASQPVRGGLRSSWAAIEANAPGLAAKQQDAQLQRQILGNPPKPDPSDSRVFQEQRPLPPNALPPANAGTPSMSIADDAQAPAASPLEQEDATGLPTTGVLRPRQQEMQQLTQADQVQQQQQGAEDQQLQQQGAEEQQQQQAEEQQQQQQEQQQQQLQEGDEGLQSQQQQQEEEVELEGKSPKLSEQALEDQHKARQRREHEAVIEARKELVQRFQDNLQERDNEFEARLDSKLDRLDQAVEEAIRHGSNSALTAERGVVNSATVDVPGVGPVGLKLLRNEDELAAATGGANSNDSALKESSIVMGRNEDVAAASAVFASSSMRKLIHRRRCRDGNFFLQASAQLDDLCRRSGGDGGDANGSGSGGGSAAVGGSSGSSGVEDEFLDDRDSRRHYDDRTYEMQVS